MFSLKNYSTEFVNSVITIIIAVFLYGCSVGIDFVIIPIMFENAGLDKTTIGMIFALELSTILIVAPFLPKIISKFGIIKWIIIAVFLRNIPLLALPLYHSKYYWAMLMFVCGFGGCCMFSTMQIWINSIASNENRGTVIGIVSAFFAAGIAVGPVIINYIDNHGVIPFAVSAGISSLMLFPLLIGKKILPENINNIKTPIKEIIRKAPIPIIGGMLCDFVYFSFSGFLVLFGTAHGLLEDQAALLISYLVIGSIILDIPVGWLSDKVNRGVLIATCILLILATIMLLPMVITNSLYSALVLAVLCGCLGGIFTSSLSILGDKYRGNDLITANSAFAVINCLGGVMGFVITGIATDIFGKNGIVYSISLACIIALLFSVFMLSKKENIAKFE
jgi:MFS family permease